MPKSRPAKSSPTIDRPDVLDQLRKALRAAVDDERRSAYSIAAEAGIHRIQVGRFLAGGDLSGKSIAGLCRALRLELRTFGRASRAA